MCKIVKIIVFILLISNSLLCNNDDYLGLNLNYYNFFNFADFKELPGVPNCCPRFNYGFDNNLGLQIFYRDHIDSDFYFQLGVGYYSLSSKFQSKENDTFGLKDGYINGEFTHYLNANIELVNFSPSISYFYNNFNFNLGLGFAYFLNRNYNQREQITQPDNRGTFLDSLGKDSGSRIRNSNSGSFNDERNLSLSVIPRLAYTLELNKNKSIFIEPSIALEYNLFDVSKSMNWSSFNISAGISLIFKLNSDNEFTIYQTIPIDSIKPLPLDTLQHINNRSLDFVSDFEKAFKPIYINTIDTVVSNIQKFDNMNTYKKGNTIIEYDTMVIKKKLTIRRTKFRYDTLGIDKNKEYFKTKILDNNNKEVKNIIINETLLTIETPLLNKLFFEKNQLDISQNIINNDIDSIPYNNLFKLLKARYKISKNKIIIKLLESNGSSTDDSIRIHNVYNYLYNNLNYNKNDISIEKDNVLYNNYKGSLSVIELETNDLKEPYITIDTVKRLLNEELIIKSDYNIKNPIINYNIKIYADTSLIFDTNYNSIQVVHFDLNDILNFIDYSTSYLRFVFTINSQNEKWSDERIIRNTYHSIDKSSLFKEKIPLISKKIIVNFDYNSNILSKSNIEFVQAINSNIKGSANVTIVGYTDDVGNSEYNKNLSLQRAIEVGKYITNGNIKIVGAGINKKYLSNKTPEGKFYSRSVEIIISDN